MNSEQQKIDVWIGDMSLTITPAAIRTLVDVTKSMGKLQTAAQYANEKKRKKSNAQILFDIKPFKDAGFWFIEDTDEKQQMIEQMDISGSNNWYSFT